MIGRLEKPVLNPAHETLKINLLNFTLECKCTQPRIQRFRVLGSERIFTTIRYSDLQYSAKNRLRPICCMTESKTIFALCKN